MIVEPEPTPRRGPLLQKGTLSRALLMFGLLALGVLFIAWVWPDRRPESEVERYLRRGQTAGAEAMRRELLRLSPPGSDSGPAIQHLIALGFACAAPASGAGEWHCTHRRPDRGRRLAVLEARIRLEGGMAAGITVQFREEPLP
ncbi:MAG: hypothetical protein N3D18_04885 [Roseococcus sp.]|nr:hypothetical protein [Roseococcus sp.]